MTIEALQQRLGYVFANPSLLRQALTHRSHGHHNNERLEFLGDSVLNFAVSALLFERFGKLDEGDLSRLRANLVKQQSLYEIAQKLDISPNLLLGEGELKSGGFRRPSILGDTLEAILGAIYLDSGFTAAQGVIERLYVPVLKAVDPKTLGKDAKTLLQEHLQGRKIPLPVYSVVATHGAAHNQLFEVECAIPKLDIQVLGSGGSRRAAEQAAAKLALDRAMATMPASGRRTRAKAADKASAVPMPAPAPETVGVVRPARSAAATPASASPATSATPVPVTTVSTEARHAEAAHSPDSGDDRPRSAERAEQGDPSGERGAPMGDRPSGEGDAPEADAAGNGSSSGHDGHHLDAGGNARALIDPTPAPERARPTQRSA